MFVLQVHLCGWADKCLCVKFWKGKLVPESRTEAMETLAYYQARWGWQHRLVERNGTTTKQKGSGS
jgi:hypothetical protein